jgi:hypothetical protein
MTEKKEARESNIPEMLYFISQRDTRISCSEFETILQKEINENINHSAFHELLKFISNQYGYWMANWYFSNIGDPDLEAKSELEQWDQLWQASASSLAESISIPLDQLQREHNLITLRESLQRRVDFNKSRVFERLLTSIYSFIAIQLNKVGVKTIANNIYTKSLYPKGTVGRNA